MIFSVPIIGTVIGEGGSGGALGIGVADRVLILKNAHHSVISPEGCAAILGNNCSAASSCGGTQDHGQAPGRVPLVDEIVPNRSAGRAIRYLVSEATAKAIADFPVKTTSSS